jgi:hypothetical protein
VRRADNLTTFVCRFSRNPGALTSWTAQGHVGLFRVYFTYIYIYIYIYIYLKETCIPKHGSVNSIRDDNKQIECEYMESSSG